jgi:hypothetical protein
MEPCPLRSIKLELLYQISLSASAARVGYAAGDTVTKNMVFPFSTMQSGTEREIQEGTSWRVSWPLLGACQEVASKSVQRGAKLYARL